MSKMGESATKRHVRVVNWCSSNAYLTPESQSFALTRLSFELTMPSKVPYGSASDPLGHADLTPLNASGTPTGQCRRLRIGHASRVRRKIGITRPIKRLQGAA
jgi:hypothetical protein